MNTTINTDIGPKFTVTIKGQHVKSDMSPRMFSIIPVKGPKGDDGQPGRDGTIENLSVEATTLPAGSSATASYSGNTLTLGIPTGATGAAGVGVPTGGTTGQVLKKKSGTNYDTEWANESGGTGIPDGGTTGQALIKASNDDGDVEWGDAGGKAIGISSTITGAFQQTTWSWDAINAGAPSGGTCYTFTILRTAIETGDYFIYRGSSGFHGITYVTAILNYLKIETSVSPDSNPSLSGEVVKGDGGAFVKSTIFHPDIPTGGTTGQVLAKSSETDYDVSWASSFTVAANAGAHNCLYRGKYLGSSVTAAQYAAISAGTFDDLFIGDYWTINGVNWRIAAFDYWLRTGDTECTTHHVVIVPDTCLVASCKMNTTDTATGAYINSDYYKGANSNTGKATAKAAIEGAFGANHILSHREFLKNTINTNYESSGAWYNSTFELMNELMVYGCDVYHNYLHGTSASNFASNSKSQLPLFRHDHSIIGIQAAWWLRDVVSSTGFALVSISGTINSAAASNSNGIRPAFGIVG